MTKDLRSQKCNRSRDDRDDYTCQVQLELTSFVFAETKMYFFRKWIQILWQVVIDKMGLWRWKCVCVCRECSRTYRIQRRRGSEVRQEANLQHLEQEALVLDAVNSVQEEHHGGLVVGTETSWHVRFGHCAIWRLVEQNKNQWKGFTEESFKCNMISE